MLAPPGAWQANRDLVHSEHLELHLQCLPVRLRIDTFHEDANDLMLAAVGQHGVDGLCHIHLPTLAGLRAQQSRECKQDLLPNLHHVRTSLLRGVLVELVNELACQPTHEITAITSKKHL